ncbi:MAG: hypothetical protein NZ521_09775, partial [Flammeovirgaceae bacterium]|nr:hypothetical protein [Flammeovirgaceae bacterium]MDW8288508.1 hypothetical protein [Flammeovirgaceae bacterium]
MNRKKSFEQQWQEAFQHQEITPSPHVWKKIAQRLSSPTFFFEKYSLETAAAIAILFIIGWYYWLNLGSPQKEGEKIDENAVLLNYPQDPTPNCTGMLEEYIVATSPEEPSSSPSKTTVVSKVKETAQRETTSSAPVSATLNPSSDVNTSIDKNQSPDNDILTEELPYRNAKLSVSPITVNFYPTYQHPTSLFPTETRKKTVLFGELLAGRIVFNPNFNTKRDYEQMLYELENRAVISGSFNSGENMVAFLRSVRKTQEMSPNIESSYVWGGNVGVNIGQRLHLQTGVLRKHFLVSSYSYAILWNLNRINITQLDFSTLDHLYKKDYRMESVVPYKIYYEYDFVSVPIQASYKVIDRKIDFSISTGISTEFFLENKIYAQRVAANTMHH